MKHKDITINNDYKLEIVNFVDSCYRTNKDEYKRRGQSDPSKIKQDIYYGKLAEYAVYAMYLEMGQECTKPDIGVYKRRNKSYSADMIVNDTFNLHVKSQLIKQSERFGLSWMFQKNDPLVNHPSSIDYVVFSLILNNNKVRVFNPVKAPDLIDIYKSPRKRELKKTKLCVYGKDIGIELG